MNWLTEVRWSPYVVGAGIGILSWLTMLISKKALGCSTTFARTAGMLEKLFRGKTAAVKAYYQKVQPKVDWQFMLVIGIIIGSFISASLSNDFNWEWVPGIWAATFGTNVLLRLAAAIVGGILIGFGARWADGCTSGHGISGAMQLSVGSWISAICFFIGGIAMAYFLFGGLF
jgi:uncharacterized protein